MKRILVTISLLLYAVTTLAKANLIITSRGIWQENTITVTLENGTSIHEITSAKIVNPLKKLSYPITTNLSFNNKISFNTPNLTKDQALELVKGPLKIELLNFAGQQVDITSVQIAKLLDKYFFYAGNDLGVKYSRNNIQLKLWAPTALDVTVKIYKEANNLNSLIESVKLQEDGGVWKTNLSTEYNKYFYLYEITVFDPAQDSIVKNIVTDPYSTNLTTNSVMSQLVDINDQETIPANWTDKKQDPNKDIVIYETHIRDLTANDKGVPKELRGTFKALTLETSEARKHLAALAQSGITHIHFLPLNDFASVEEDKSKIQNLDVSDEIVGASKDPQEKINETRFNDSYNWGYDPFHYLVPEGSYSTAPTGTSRMLELREMVLSLKKIGLKVIIDVVFNHTFSGGNDRFSVLNKVVPNYYYRLNEYGYIYNSSCCSDTASENKMMEKLMIDTSIYWIKNYKVDGLRFDLMSFHTRENMEKVKSEIEKLTLENDGVDGKNIYLYGEGWTYGSLVSTNYQKSFVQLNSYGAGIGQFNDRIRDAIRGGTTSPTEKSDQGFATGLFYDFNSEIANRNTSPDLWQQRGKLLHLGDVIKIALAGNLRDYKIKDHNGYIMPAKDLHFRGTPTAYSKTTIETVNYVSAHDGYSLFDAINAKVPFHTPNRHPSVTTAQTKQRIAALSLGLVIFSQGVPFIEGGSELLRSKSGDADSYDSGDWFNVIDWSLEWNNWAKGLPVSFKNYDDWSFWLPRLNDPATYVEKVNIQDNLKMVKAYLKIRKHSSLFDIKDLKRAQDEVTFLSNKDGEIPGFISMYLNNKKEEMIILFNASNKETTLHNEIINPQWTLHKYLTPGVDEVLSNTSIEDGKTTVPPRSIVVLVRKDSHFAN
ncbi:pullulanase-type alpha-1,6-glucosidase [Bacteriovorax sp. Seq25_V]|uniref:pullulanase-type alpha-1,6-glucosidase n=1 Tax=Bacteriovorax sp. Seq25_V TaxID=1201288 RepID=UPI00038A4DA5|nr:pullulanase-type alpha-1,6-glucosidase [Bacteriovorax sp. Seq25_V]EQC44017.1 PF11852 domain protein [Bacteriovorax sp. Seq25_V]